MIHTRAHTRTVLFGDPFSNDYLLFVFHGNRINTAVLMNVCAPVLRIIIIIVTPVTITSLGGFWATNVSRYYRKSPSIGFK